MSEEEYLAKREAYMSSDAPLNVRDEAIAKLDAEWKLYGGAAKIALDLFEKTKPDL